MEGQRDCQEKDFTKTRGLNSQKEFKWKRRQSIYEDFNDDQIQDVQETFFGRR